MKKRLKILSFKAVGTVIPHTLSDVQMAFSEMGHRVFVIDLPALEGNHLKEIAIMDALTELKPDLVFTIDSVGLLPYQYLTMHPEMKVVSWFFDNPIPFLGEMDLSLFNSRYFLFCWDKAYESEVRKMGVNRFHYLPLATNPKIYHPLNIGKKYDISFVGTWSKKRADILNYLAENGIKIDLFGDERWANGLHTNLRFHGFASNRTDCPCIYSQSKINLNITNEQLLTSLPLRIFDAGACKGFVLTDEQEDARSIFSEDELVIYKNREDLLKKINYYLNNEKEREVICNNFYKKISAEFTYVTQLNKILTILQEDQTEVQDRQPTGEELSTILWKSALSKIHFAQYDEAINFLQYTIGLEQSVGLILRNLLALAVSLKLSGRDLEAVKIINQQAVLKNSFDKIFSTKNAGEFRQILYGLSDCCFLSDGNIENGKAELSTL